MFNVKLTIAVHKFRSFLGCLNNEGGSVSREKLTESRRLLVNVKSPICSPTLNPLPPLPPGIPQLFY